MVLDADAIKLVKKEDRFGFRAVLTPHMGEYRRLLSNLGIEEDDFLTTLKKVAKTLECVMIVKSSVIWITAMKALYGTAQTQPWALPVAAMCFPE